MRGDLSETGLEDIFGELAASASTGALHLEGGTGPGKVFFRDGDVYYASSPAPRAQLGARLVGAGFIDDDELDRALAAQEQGPTRTKLGAILVDTGMVRRDVIRVFVQEQILDAVFDLARWDEGTFEFFRGDAVAEDLPVQIPTGPLLMEVRRRLSEWEDIRAVIPSLDAVPDFVRGGSTTQAALEPDEFTLLTSVDGRRSVRDLAHDLGYSQFDAARLIYGLSLLGVIALSNGEATTATAPRDASVPAGRDAEATDPRPSPEPPPEAAATEAAPPSARTADTDQPDDTGQPDVTDEPEEVDVGKALEEALFGGAYDLDEEPAGAPDEDTAEPRHELDEGPVEDLEEVSREAARSTEDRSPPRDLSAGSDDLEPEIWSASIDVGEDATEGAEDVRSGEPATEDVRPEEPVVRPQPRADRSRDVPEEAEPVPAATTDDDAADARNELMALVGELQDVTSGEEAPEEEVPEEEVPEPEPEPETADTEAPGDRSETVETVEPPRPRPEPEAHPEEPAERTERGDVSELLRELSRLAGGGPEPVTPTPDAEEEPGRPGDSAEPDREEPDEPQQPDEPRPRSGDDDDDDDKRSTFRRLFGSR